MIALSACSDSESTGDGTADSGGASGTGGAAGTGGTAGVAGESGTLENFRSRFVLAACDNLFSCLWGGDALATRWFLGERGRCLEFFDAAYGPDIQARADAVARGSLAYVPEQAEHCLSVLSQACLLFEAEEPLDALELACEGVFEGSVQEGGDCASDEECAGSARCEVPPLDDAICLGRCRARGAPGDPCDYRQMCSASGGDSASCDSGRCVLVSLGGPVGAGQACGRRVIDAVTQEIVPCEPGLFCNADTSGVGVCEPPHPVGAACASEHEPCLDGALCLDSAQGRVCTVAVVQTSAGAPCRAAEYEICDSAAGLVCNAAELCEAAPAGGCGATFTCGTGEVCFDEQCLPIRATGEECSFDFECATRLCAQAHLNEPQRCYERICSEW